MITISTLDIKIASVGDLTATSWYSGAQIYHTVDMIEGAPSLSPVLLTGAEDADGVGNVGQIGIDSTKWPVIQTFDFTIETFEIKLEQPGADEIVVLTHDNDDIDDYSSIVLDRNAATHGAYVHATITDQALNIDPTSEDVVMFNVTSGSEGVSFKHNADSGSGGTYVAFDNSFDDNGKLIIDYDANTSGADVLTDGTSADDLTADKYLIFWETAENSGVFVNTDDADVSNLTVNTSALRGATATFDYNDSAQSFVVAHDFATIDMDVTSVGDEWNSGEEMTIILYDQDLNLNTASDEDLTVKNGALVPSITIGSPLSIGTDATVNAVEIADDDANTADANPTAFSKIASVNTSTFDSTSATADLNINTKITGAQWDALVAYGGTEFINFDLQNLTTDIVSFGIGSVSGTPVTSSTTANCVALTTANAAFSSNAGSGAGDTAKEYGQITPIATNAACTASTGLFVNIIANTIIDDTDAEFVIDLFSFSGSENHAIYRVELEETGDNTAAFAGSAEYVMLNQLNVDQAATYAALNPIQDDIDMVVHLDMTDEDSIRVNYLDLGADGVSTQIADQQAAPTHSGSADLDLDSYKIADTVVVTIDDQDLNTDSELLDVYLTKADQKVGDNSGDHIMDITFDDQIWTTKALGSCSGTVTGDEGLQATGFTLVETDVDSGLFTGSFQVPTNFCHSGSDTIVAVTGTDIEVNYNDFRDGSGNTIEVGDGASIRANTGSVSFR